jgi:pilus assembly protein Flp/PilA
MVRDLFVRGTAVVAAARAGIRRRLGNEVAATAAEYALLVALIALAIIAGATALGIALNANLGNAGSTLNGL